MTEQQLHQAATNYRAFLHSLGVDVDQEHLEDTPIRVARMYEELLEGEPEPNFKFTTFSAAKEKSESLVVVREITFYSLCSHHMIPFFGTAHVAYLPGDKICGLSKIARTVRHFAARLQVQEFLSDQIADFLEEKLEPKGVGVILQARHLCMEMRGVRQPCASTVTSAMRGLFLSETTIKDEFLKLIELSK